MNILLVTQIYPEPDDSKGYEATRTVEYFAREWAEAGHKVVVMHCPSRFPFFYYMMPRFLKNQIGKRTRVLIPTWSSTKPIDREEHGIQIYREPMTKWIPSQAYSKQAMENQCHKIKERLSEIGFKPDLIAGHFSNPSTELVGRLSESCQAMSSIVFHHDCTARTLKKYRIKENIGRINAVGARSVIEAAAVKEMLGLEEQPFICYSGVPNDAVNVSGKSCMKQEFKEEIQFLYVGSLIQKKHVDTVIKAYSELKRDYRNGKISLRLIGSGLEEGALKELAQQLGVSGTVRFMGRLPRKDVLHEMKKAHIFTMVSDDETFGMVYLEAMLQGCIVIASKGGGFDGIIKDGVNGFLCEAGNADMLKQIYERIIRLDTKERNRIGQNAVDTAVQFSEKAVAERYLNDVIERNKKRQSTK